MNMLDTIAPKTDQLNSDDLIGGRTLTITVSKVTAGSDATQPVELHYAGGLPYRPCKSMRRVLVSIWGPDAKAYTGRSLTLYRDDSVMFGGVAVGGLRISHMSHMESEVTLALTASKAKRKPYKVLPLKVTGKVSASSSAFADLLAEYERCQSQADFDAAKTKLAAMWPSLSKTDAATLKAVGEAAKARIANEHPIVDGVPL